MKYHKTKNNTLTYIKFVAIFVMFFAIESSMQFINGAFTNEFGGSPDEAGHYITGLMVRDYVASFTFEQPMKFAENYYIHYPKVSLGHWPPFFYIVQAAWTLLFSPSRLSVMLLMAFLSTLLSITVYVAIKREFGAFVGIGAGVLLLTLPLIQEYSGMVMAEILVALLSFWAVLCFGRYLDTMRWRWSIGFGICLSLAMMTKGNGLALLLVPPLALLLGRRVHLVTRLSFWSPLVMMLVLCVPWYWLTLGMVQNGMRAGSPSLGFTLAAIPYYTYHLIKIMGAGLSLLVAVGFIVRIVLPYRNRTLGGQWIAFGALLVSVWVFHIVTPAGLENRHLTMVVPVLVMFLVPGMLAVAARLPGRNLAYGCKVAVLAVLVTVLFLEETFAFPIKAWYGFGEVAESILSTPDYQKSVIMISSDSFGDGMFISEVALRERRPGHVVLRASKVLARSRWDGSNYKILYSTPKEMMNYLEGVPVGIIVIDLSVPLNQQTEEHQVLIKTLDVYARRWELLGSHALTRGGTAHPEAIQVYRLRGHENLRVGTVRLDMHEMLNRSIETTF